MTDRLTELAALEAQATRAPWKVDLNRQSDSAPPYLLSQEGSAWWPFATALWRTHPPDKASEDAMVAQLEADFELCVAARNALPALLELVRLHREWVEAKKAIKGKPLARPFADFDLVKALRDAESALASWTGGRV